jgi:hypothetical protein
MSVLRVAFEIDPTVALNFTERLKSDNGSIKVYQMTKVIYKKII